MEAVRSNFVMAAFISKAENSDDSKPSMGCHGASEDTELCCRHDKLDQASEFQKLFLLLPSACGKHFSPPTSLKSERLFLHGQRTRNAKAEGVGSHCWMCHLCCCLVLMPSVISPSRVLLSPSQVSLNPLPISECECKAGNQWNCPINNWLLKSICLSLQFGSGERKGIIKQSIGSTVLRAGKETRKRINAVVKPTAHQWEGGEKWWKLFWGFSVPWPHN